MLPKSKRELYALSSSRRFGPLRLEELVDAVALKLFSQSQLYFEVEEELLSLRGISDSQRFRETIVYWFHCGPFGGHKGITATSRRIKAYLWWPQVERDVKKFIHACMPCTRNRFPAAPSTTRTLERPTPFDLVSCDFVGPRSVGGGKTFTAQVPWWLIQFEIDGSLSLAPREWCWQSSIGDSPFGVLFGKPPCLPGFQSLSTETAEETRRGIFQLQQARNQLRPYLQRFSGLARVSWKS
eukprot:Selendium_serpulae@DN5061_c0_g1_i8.p1